MRRALAYLVIAGALALAVGLWITAPNTAPPETFSSLQGNAETGEVVFTAAGCASCHAAPGSEGEDKLILAGGQEFASDFGTFYAPNISPAAAGIGGWTPDDLGNALRFGTTPDGKHYYPAFPFGAYQHMSDQDVVDLHAYLLTLPQSDEPSRDHDVGFPFSVRRGVGAWKLLFLSSDFVVQSEDPLVVRGRYLVEALGHCGECHTPRGALGQLDRSRWLQGAPNPSGRGNIPGITPDELGWVAEDIAYYLETGFTPDFDSAGGKMAEVIENTAKLTADDRQAIARYLVSLQ